VFPPGKRQSVTQILFQMPPEVFDLVAKHVSENTWDLSVFSDEALANKRIYPGHLYKHAKPGWQVSGLTHLTQNLRWSAFDI
jgi:hypothetical protein